MKKLFFLIVVFGGCFSPEINYAQGEQEIDVEQSAEVFLEEYSDAFQENFFEGLKQKGIQNYDRAITYFMECKRLQPENDVVTFELAKSHLLEKKVILAQEYAVEAINANPENYWYAETLTDVVEARKVAIDEVTGNLPWNNVMLRGNMAEIYFKKGNYQTAKKIIKGVKKSAALTKLENRILDSIAKGEINTQSISLPVKRENREEVSGLEQFRTKIQEVLKKNSFDSSLERLTEEAMERFPTQPFFYYANGYALNKLQKPKDAIEMLEAALDFLIEDVALENKIYKELVDAYTTLNNTEKANRYRSKIKPGF
ncbi:tetratricopeptide repeat protein [Maribacter sp. X9]|uniref:tetratricopeptide repeat protein n=1 Tax=Maribacter sp. X9 TaxID=3402159 RepID=UPI003AF33341